MKSGLIIIGIESKNLTHFQNEGFETLNVNVQDILTQKWLGSKVYEEPLYFVSPANSLGYMDGGIDKAYMGMFKDIQPKVQGSIKKLIPEYNNVTKLGRPYLPIGSAIKVPVEDSNYLISAPTMLQPQPVQNTKNAYWATRAALKVWSGTGTIFVPLMCCGYGKMDPQEATRQMKQAYDEYVLDSKKSPNSVIDYYLEEPNMDEQPNYYENTEFKDIPIEKIEQKGSSEFKYFVKRGLPDNSDK